MAASDSACVRLISISACIADCVSTRAPPIASCASRWIRRAGAFIRWCRWPTARRSRDSYREHIDLCLACRGAKRPALPAFNTAAWWKPRGRYRAARPASAPDPLAAHVRFRTPAAQPRESAMIVRPAYRTCGMQQGRLGMLKFPGRLGRARIAGACGRVAVLLLAISAACFRREGERKYRVAFLAGCIANVSFARLNEATVRVLQANGCEVSIPGAKPAAERCMFTPACASQARKLARQNIDAASRRRLRRDHHQRRRLRIHAEGIRRVARRRSDYARASRFAALMKDVNEFLASIELNPRMGEVRATVTYQDSCHLAHGQKIRSAPRQLLARVPGLTLKEMRTPDACCGSAGIYNVVHTDMSMALLEKKMEASSRLARSASSPRIPAACFSCALAWSDGATASRFRTWSRFWMRLTGIRSFNRSLWSRLGVGTLAIIDAPGFDLVVLWNP